VPKGSRRLGGLDDMIISLYAGGVTIADIVLGVDPPLDEVPRVPEDPIAMPVEQHAKRLAVPGNAALAHRLVTTRHLVHTP
jgi:hypothetical protein